MSPRRRSRPDGSEPAASPARAAAFRVLRDVGRRRGEPASRLEAIAYRVLLPPDRDLATEIVYGVLRWQARLDFVLAAHSARPLESLSETVLLALRIGLYQLRHLSRVPARAAVDESVRLARTFGAARAAGYVNAVLRNAERRPDTPALPSAEADPLEFLAVTLSHPRWLAARYLERLGPARAAALCRLQNEPPETFCRVSRRIAVDEAVASLATEGILARPFELVPGCLRVERGRVQRSALFARGLLFVQEAGAQLLPLLLEPQAGDRVLDVCAAPGGKALATVEGVGDGGCVVAVELREPRARLMAELASRAGARRLLPIVSDGRALPLRTRFSKILLDAPCTSLGTVRRNPDIKWRVEERDLQKMAERQVQLLHAASEALAPGGRLVYATCSTEPEENEEVVARCLRERRDLRQLSAAPSLPESAIGLVDASGAFRSSPERDGIDAYFAAVLTRVDGSPASASPR